MSSHVRMFTWAMSEALWETVNRRNDLMKNETVNDTQEAPSLYETLWRKRLEIWPQIHFRNRKELRNFLTTLQRLHTAGRTGVGCEYAKTISAKAAAREEEILRTQKRWHPHH